MTSCLGTFILLAGQVTTVYGGKAAEISQPILYVCANMQKTKPIMKYGYVPDH